MLHVASSLAREHASTVVYRKIRRIEAGTVGGRSSLGGRMKGSVLASLPCMRYYDYDDGTIIPNILNNLV